MDCREEPGLGTLCLPFMRLTTSSHFLVKVGFGAGYNRVIFDRPASEGIFNALDGQVKGGTSNVDTYVVVGCQDKEGDAILVKRKADSKGDAQSLAAQFFLVCSENFRPWGQESIQWASPGVNTRSGCPVQACSHTGCNDLKSPTVSPQTSNEEGGEGRQRKMYFL